MRKNRKARDNRHANANDGSRWKKEESSTNCNSKRLAAVVSDSCSCSSAFLCQAIVNVSLRFHSHQFFVHIISPFNHNLIALCKTHPQHKYNEVHHHHHPPRNCLRPNQFRMGTSIHEEKSLSSNRRQHVPRFFHAVG